MNSAAMHDAGSSAFHIVHSMSHTSRAVADNAAIGSDAVSSASVQICVDMDLSGGHVGGAHAPVQSRIDPGIGRRCRHELYLQGQVDDPLTVAPGPDAVCGKRNPIPIVGFAS